MLHFVLVILIAFLLIWLDYVFAIKGYVKTAKPFITEDNCYFYCCRFDEIGQEIDLPFIPTVSKPLHISRITKKPTAMSIILYRSLFKD